MYLIVNSEPSMTPILFADQILMELIDDHITKKYKIETSSAPCENVTCGLHSQCISQNKLLYRENRYKLAHSHSVPHANDNCAHTYSNFSCLTTSLSTLIVANVTPGLKKLLSMEQWNVLVRYIYI